MKVYKFTSAKHAKMAIRNKMLKISTFNELNDPFELSATNLRNPGMGAFNRSAKNYIGNEYGLISFSREYTSPLMWGHYAESHTGICLGFEVPDEDLIPVRYRQDRLKFDGKTSLSYDDVINLVSVKFTDWQYEKESRMVVPLNAARKENGLYFESFSEKLRLTEVLLGVQCQDSAVVYEELLAQGYNNYKLIHVTQLSLAKTKFGVTKTKHKFT